MTQVLLITLATLFILGSGIYLVFARDLSAARARLISHSESMAAPFGTLEYAVVGDGDPVLVIHGAGGGFDQGMEMTGALAAHGYRLIVPSRFGYLASSLPANPTTAMQADAYIDLLNNLGINRVFVLGISAGEWSALQFTIRHPERCRALALIVPANYLPPNKPNYGGPLVKLIFCSDFAAWSVLKLTALMPGAMTEPILGTKPADLHHDWFGGYLREHNGHRIVARLFKSKKLVRKSLAPAVTSVDRRCPRPSCESQDNSFLPGHELDRSRESSGITLKLDRVNPGDFEPPFLAICSKGQADSVNAVLKPMSSNRHQRPVLEFRYRGPITFDPLHAGCDPFNRPADPIAARIPWRREVASGFAPLGAFSFFWKHQYLGVHFLGLRFAPDLGACVAEPCHS